MSAAERLSAAKALIVDPAAWTRRTSARDAAGEEVASTANEACSFCALGALWRIFDGETMAPAELECERFLEAALPQDWHDVAAFNDARDHADVIALYDRAIALAEAAA